MKYYFVPTLSKIQHNVNHDFNKLKLISIICAINVSQIPTNELIIMFIIYLFVTNEAGNPTWEQSSQKQT